MNLILIKLNFIETSVEKNLLKNNVTQHSLAYKNTLIYSKNDDFVPVTVTIFGYH
jgi:hypothetical protein